ncbi:MAG: hypothetical protein KC548_04995 [Nanoarchaeota archaeon]|nr:hypothetical protein [Nanoarchaeota archaeon]
MESGLICRGKGMVGSPLFLRFFLFLFLFFSLLCSSFANVEVFSKYDTVLRVNNNDTIDVNKSLTLKNVYEVGIVPGQIEFKIGKGTDGSISQLDVTEVYAVDQYHNPIKAQVRKSDDYSVIILDVYYPLLPGFEYTFDLFYTIKYEPGGIFFKSLHIPIRESTIPIKEGLYKVVLPDNYHFTFLNEESENVTLDDNTATWAIRDDLPKSIEFEYSFVPVKIANFKGSYVFWIIVNVLLLSFLVLEVRREIKKVKAKSE